MRVPFQPNRLTEIVDVGAAGFDSAPCYRAMLEAGHCKVKAFDPQAHFPPKQSPNLTFLPDTIGDGTSATLHVFTSPGMTSLLLPEQTTLDALSPVAAGGSSWGKVKTTIPVETKRLDAIEDVTSIDMLRMDAQGAELMIMKGAGAKLDRTVAVQTEVSFVTLYVGQPLFGDIHEFLAAKGFVFYTFTEFHVRTIGPSNGRGRHIIQADAVYVKDFRDMSTWSIDQLKHMAMIARWCYGADDLAHRCVKQLEKIDHADNGPRKSDDGKRDRIDCVSGGACG